MADLQTLTGYELGQAVVTEAKRLWQADTRRRARMLENISRFENERLTSLSPDAYHNATGLKIDETTKVRWNLSRALVNTVTAKIAGSQQPKVQFVASNADWSTRRRGPKLDAFVTGLWSTQQGPYSDVWELGVFAFRDAAVCGLGAVKSWSDTDAGRVLHEKCYPWELLTDARDASRGTPSNLFQVFSCSREQLKALFSEKSGEIESAPAWRGDGDESFLIDQFLDSGVVDQVRCYEWWSLPFGPDSPGKHVLALDGCVLIEEPWERDSFPFAIIRWDRKFQGWEGTSLIDEVSSIDDEMNDVLARISNSVRLTSMGVMLVPDTCDITKSDLTNEDAINVRYDGPQPPTWINPEAFGQQHLQYLELIESRGFRYSGVNEMTATAQKQTGIESGAAIRTMADLQSERFSVAWRAYQNLFVEIARNDIACVRELAEDDPKFSVKWPGNGFLKTIKWAACDLEDDLYTVQVAAAPSVKGTPADRIQTAQELLGAGLLSNDAFLAVRTYLDLPGEIDRASRQRNVIDQYIEAWLDATPEEIEANEDESGNPVFRPPVRFMRLEDALIQVADAYFQAELDNAPDVNKELFLRWIELADDEIQKKAARLAAAQTKTIEYRRAAEQPPVQPQEMAHPQ